MSDLDPIADAEPIRPSEEAGGAAPKARPAAPRFEPRRVFPEGAGALGGLPPSSEQARPEPTRPEPLRPEPLRPEMAAKPGSPFALPEGARCGVHSEREARFVCTRCGVFGCEECAFTLTAKLEVCRACATGGLPEPIPWERRKELGHLKALWATIKLVSFQPQLFYRTPPTERGAAWPILFGIVAYGLGQMLWQLQLGLLFMAGAGVSVAAFEQNEIGALLGVYGCALTGLSPFLLLQAPFYGILSTAVAAGAQHGLLTWMKRARGSFEDTLRTVAYANGPLFFACIPILGPLIGYLWCLRTEIVGAREQHKLSTDRAALAVLGFRILLTLLIGGFYTAVVALFVFLELRQLPVVVGSP